MLTKKKMILVMFSFRHLEELKPPFLKIFFALFSVKQLIVPCVLNSSPCVFCTCTSVPVCGCEGVTMVPLSLLEIRSCPINTLSVISGVFYFSDDN